MTIDVADWSYEVEIRLDRFTAATTLRLINFWLTTWEMPYGVRSSTGMGPGILRVCFTEERFARAFHLKFGGYQVLPTRQLAIAPIDFGERRIAKAAPRLH